MIDLALLGFVLETNVHEILIALKDQKQLELK